MFRISFATLTFLKGLWMFYEVSLNRNLVRQGRGSKQKLSRVSQLPFYQSHHLILFLKGPIVFSRDCEIVTCWATGGAGQLGGQGCCSPSRSQLCSGWQMWGSDTPSPPGRSMGSCRFQPTRDFAWQIPFHIWINSPSQRDSQVLFYASYSRKE